MIVELDAIMLNATLEAWVSAVMMIADSVPYNERWEKKLIETDRN